MIDAEDNYSNTYNIRYRLKDDSTEHTLKKGELFTIKGKVSVSFDFNSTLAKTQINIYDAEIVSTASEKPVGSLTIDQYDRNEPAFIGSFYQMINNYYMALGNKEIIVEGPYHSTQSSTVTSGTYHTVVVGTNGETPVRCNMIDAPDSDALTALRNDDKNIKIKGLLTGAQVNPIMDSCVVVQ